MSTVQEVFQAFYTAKKSRSTGANLLEHFVVAAQPFVDRGFTPVMTGSPSLEDLTVARDLTNRGMEAVSNKKAADWGQGYANTEGVYRSGYDLNVECLARIIMNPGAMTKLERQYSLLAQMMRCDDHQGAMAMLGDMLRNAGGVVKADTSKLLQALDTAKTEALKL